MPENQDRQKATCLKKRFLYFGDFYKLGGFFHNISTGLDVFPLLFQGDFFAVVFPPLFGADFNSIIR